MIVVDDNTVAVLIWVATETRCMRVHHVSLYDYEIAEDVIAQLVGQYQTFPNWVVYIDGADGSDFGGSTFATLVDMLSDKRRN